PQQRQPLPSYPCSVDVRTCATAEDRYPRLSKQLNEQGTVVLRFVIETNGGVTSVEVAKSSGYRRLDQETREILKTCRFRPAMVEGNPEKCSTTLEVLWKLE
ncbi:MAG: energy transducer TonB, partial [Betaproteobacteria bacterium]|nr:energy transducer TonB [Betaproteobacteria bacterium]